MLLLLLYVLLYYDGWMEFVVFSALVFLIQSSFSLPFLSLYCIKSDAFFSFLYLSFVPRYLFVLRLYKISLSLLSFILFSILFFFLLSVYLCFTLELFNEITIHKEIRRRKKLSLFFVFFFFFFQLK